MQGAQHAGLWGSEQEGVHLAWCGKLTGSARPARGDCPGLVVLTSFFTRPDYCKVPVILGRQRILL